MSRISNIMWYLSSPDSSSLSENISWLWVESLHTHTLSLSLSLSPFPIQGPHMYTKKMCVRWLWGVLLEGKEIVLLGKVDSLAYYIEMCKVETSKVQNAWVRGVSTRINCKPGKNGQPFQVSKGRHTPGSAFVHRQERTSVRAVIPHHLAGGGGC